MVVVCAIWTASALGFGRIFVGDPSAAPTGNFTGYTPTPQACV